MTDWIETQITFDVLLSGRDLWIVAIRTKKKELCIYSPYGIELY